jgi:hypothetical protein
MIHVKELQDKFSSLDINSKNYALYERLLSLDISDYKPLMQEILDGRLDIEDTRQLLNNVIPSSNTISTNRKLSENIVETMKSNLISRLTGEGTTNIIKENQLFFNNIDDYKYAIAKEYESQTGKTLTDDEVNSILVVVEETYYQQLNLEDIEGQNKDTQLFMSDKMSYKPISEL